MIIIAVKGPYKQEYEVAVGYREHSSGYPLPTMLYCGKSYDAARAALAAAEGVAEFLGEEITPDLRDGFTRA